MQLATRNPAVIKTRSEMRTDNTVYSYVTDKRKEGSEIEEGHEVLTTIRIVIDTAYI